jgi:hypothetical protein
VAPRVEANKKERGMETKEGVKTSEFWTAVLSVVLGALPAALTAMKGNAVVAAIIGAVSLVGPVVYIWGRSILKAEQAKQTDLLPDEWEARMASILDAVEKLTQSVQETKGN